MRPRIFIYTGLICLLLALGLQTSPATDTIPGRADFGTAQLTAIQARYDATPDDCGGPDKPAVLCSGVLIRNTGDGNGYHVWNPSPAAVRLDAVSFSYLRADANFGGFGLLEGWASFDGLIFSPEAQADAATLHPIMRCAYPVDGWTSNRDKGCGAYNGAATSRPCQTQGIHTAAQWFQHFSAAPVGDNYGYKQCGFATVGVHDAASAFLATLQARTFLSPAQFAIHNELILATWPQNIGASLPIEAFFYFAPSGKPSGLAGAQRNQRDLLQTVGVPVPIIRLVFPSAPDQRAAFTYDPAEQVIPLPALPASLDEPPVVVQASAGTLHVQDILSRRDIEVSVPAQSDLPAGSTGHVRWMGTRGFYETPAEPMAADMPTIFSIPRGSVLATLGQSVDVSFVVTSKALAVEQASRVQTISVEGAATLPPPEIAADRASARIGYPGMLGTDQIWVSYEGNDVHDTPFPRKTATFNAGITPSWLGAPDQIYYWVKRGAEFLVSPVLSPTHGPWPVVHDAPNSWLDFAALTADPVVTVAPWDDIAAGQSVRLDALAYFPDGTEQHIPLVDDAIVDDNIVKEGLRAALPRDQLRRLPDGSAIFLRTRVAVAGSELDRAHAFPVTRLTLRNAPGPIVTKPLPRLVDGQADGILLPIDGMLSRSALTGTAQVRVAPWPGMAAGQRVWLRLRGRKTDGSELVVDLAPNYAVVAADLVHGLLKNIPPAQLDLLADQSPFAVELKVGFEKLADETRALRFPVNHFVYGK